MTTPFDEIRFDDIKLPSDHRESPGSLFQHLVANLLEAEAEDKDDLLFFPAGGKDGLIDHCIRDKACFKAADPYTRYEKGLKIIECKKADSLSHAKKAWNKIEDRFMGNITEKGDARKGQKQYKPWVNKNQPIKSYNFYVSFECSNEQLQQELETPIENFFRNAIKNKQGLEHLNNITVIVIGWKQILNRLKDHPHLLFKWFPKVRVHGLSVLSLVLNGYDGFKSYLNNSGYLLNDDERKHPDNILNRLDDESLDGFIITGIGGIGKSRLLLEIGKEALRSGWLVLFVDAKSCKSETIELLAKEIKSKDKVLFLFDHLESHENFESVIDKIYQCNIYSDYYFKYIASCRNNFAYKVEGIKGKDYIQLDNDFDEAGNDCNPRNNGEEVKPYGVRIVEL